MVLKLFFIHSQLPVTLDFSLGHVVSVQIYGKVFRELSEEWMHCGWGTDGHFNHLESCFDDYFELCSQRRRKGKGYRQMTSSYRFWVGSYRYRASVEWGGKAVWRVRDVMLEKRGRDQHLCYRLGLVSLHRRGNLTLDKHCSKRGCVPLWNCLTDVPSKRPWLIMRV